MNSEVLCAASSQLQWHKAPISRVREIASGFRSEGSYLAILSQIARVGNSADSGFLI